MRMTEPSTSIVRRELEHAERLIGQQPVDTGPGVEALKLLAELCVDVLPAKVGHAWRRCSVATTSCHSSEHTETLRRGSAHSVTSRQPAHRFSEVA